MKVPEIGEARTVLFDKEHRVCTVVGLFLHHLYGQCVDLEYTPKGKRKPRTFRVVLLRWGMGQQAIAARKHHDNTRKTEDIAAEAAA